MRTKKRGGGEKGNLTKSSPKLHMTNWRGTRHKYAVGFGKFPTSTCSSWRHTYNRMGSNSDMSTTTDLALADTHAHTSASHAVAVKASPQVFQDDMCH